MRHNRRAGSLQHPSARPAQRTTAVLRSLAQLRLRAQQLASLRLHSHAQPVHRHIRVLHRGLLGRLHPAHAHPPPLVPHAQPRRVRGNKRVVSGSWREGRAAAVCVRLRQPRDFARLIRDANRGLAESYSYSLFTVCIY